ncbi:MAG: GmrSD restriction endonuclease domain-containing protein [Sulfuricella sp.]
MKAEDTLVTNLLEGAKQFIVPIFQRDYSWGTKHCQQLWKDVIRVGSDPNVKGHFLGSVVYVAAEDNTATITRWLLIDGQQRMTTLTLLLIALRDRMMELQGNGDGGDEVSTPEELDDYYLRNRHGKGDRRHKLHLRRADHETLIALLDGRGIPDAISERVKENFIFLRDLVAQADVPTVYAGIKKLVVVDVCLTRGQDDPQMIFESLNSTGVDLTQADLIRNFVLMRLDETSQTQLYEEHWQPIEVAFGRRYRTEFDKFVKDFLTLQLRPGTPLKAAEIYHEFRSFFSRTVEKRGVDGILSDLRRFGTYYTAFSLGQEKQPALKEAFARLRSLIEVASPVVLTLYDCHERAKTLSADEFVEAIELLESFVFRRSVCDMQTRSLGQMFASLAYRITEAQPLLSLKVALYRQGKKRRFPSDAEFREALESRDVYDMRTCFYLLDRLENFSKERIDTSSFTIEHVMPQNEDLRPEWRAMLGNDWQAAQETWLHRLGNLTLTGYNSTYSDRSFAEKKAIAGGFNESPLRLNKFIREQSAWTTTTIEQRGKQLAEKALGVWRPLVVDPLAVKQRELDEHKALAANYQIENVEMDEVAKQLFDAIQPQIQALGTDVVELPNDRSVIYRVFDFFVEIIPRKQRLSLLLNLDFADCEDASGKARDATEFAFIIGAMEAGGVIYTLEAVEDVPAAINVVRQAYERVTE